MEEAGRIQAGQLRKRTSAFLSFTRSPISLNVSGVTTPGFSVANSMSRLNAPIRTSTSGSRSRFPNGSSTAGCCAGFLRMMSVPLSTISSRTAADWSLKRPRKSLKLRWNSVQ